MTCPWAVPDVENDLAEPAGPALAGPDMRKPPEPVREPAAVALAAQAELLDQRVVARFVLALEIVEQTTALRHQGEKATT